MINCIAIDDEPLALELLEDNIRQVPYLNLVDKFSNAIDALRLLKETSIDLVFLDIQMPGLTGLQFIQSLTTRPMFILVTAYEKFALEGFNLNVVDYLVKPVSLDRFIRACNKAQELYELRKGGDTGDGEKKYEGDYFFINVDYSLVKVMYSNIIYIEGLKDYTKIYLSDNSKPVVARLSMKSLEDELPDAMFLRIHKSYIISKNFIASVKKSSVLLSNKTELPVGDNYKERIEQMVRRKKFD
ncbi:MAG: response regulator transcription factor [Chitinophagaceae bacterium]|nr:response regulator transcription factor [Chitinophagaceae bacterium]